LRIEYFKGDSNISGNRVRISIRMYSMPLRVSPQRPGGH